ATYALGQVPTANYYATDSMSGVSSSVATLTGGSGFGLGTFTYAVTATDNAGNTTMMTPTYEVIATIDGSLSLISEFLASGAIDNTGLAGSLSSQLDSALAAANSGNTQTADNILNAFINHVTAQSGKHISAEAAAVLINAATYIINH
ncbi:MAG TPA: hypothetical protein VN328_05130, partial [Thermodesulfovibrionales bacterium]|nr:hypothetical protein [Thermodesulfovibrionales bacterium]